MVKHITYFNKLPYFYSKKLGRYVCLSVPSGEVSAESVYKNTLSLKELRTFSEELAKAGVPSFNERGEWTADFVDFGPNDICRELSNGYIEVLYISKPTNITPIDGRWVCEGGFRKTIVLPPPGWVVPDSGGNLYHDLTGTPLATTQNMEEAGASNYACFWRAELGTGLIAVNRECERMAGPTIEISIVQDPAFKHDDIGHRPLI